MQIDLLIAEMKRYTAFTGSASFLLPEGVMLPDSEIPPSTINFCIYIYFFL